MIKKLTSILLTLTILISSFSYIAAEEALTTQDRALVLNAINILKGDGVSFNLDGKLKRSEGATFIVRLLGKETTVLANRGQYINLPFTDVNATDWFAPYVGYCVKEGIINGYPGNTFKPNDLLSEQAFIKMVLGAMGYTIDQDYIWSNTFAFAYNKNIVTDIKYASLKTDNTNYTRGQVVDLLDHVIGQKSANPEVTMAAKLIEAGVMTLEQAKTYRYIKDTLPMAVTSLIQEDEVTFKLQFNETPQSVLPSQVIVKSLDGQETVAVKVKYTGVETVLYITTDTTVIDKQYTMTLKGIKDTEGNVMADYTHSFIGIRPKDFESNYYRINYVTSKSGSTIDVMMTQPVSATSIKPSDIFVLKSDVLEFVGSDSNIKITKDPLNPYLLHFELIGQTLMPNTEYKLMLHGNVKSDYGVHLKDGQGDNAKFVTTPMATETFAYKGTTYESDRSLVIMFNKKLNTSIATQIYSYYLTTKAGSPIKITKAEMLPSLLGVKLTTETVIDLGSEYALTINQAYDSDRTSSLLDQQYSFIAATPDKAELKIKAVKATAGDRIEVVLDQYMDETSAVKLSNYTIEGITDDKYTASITSIYYDKYAVNPTVIIHIAVANKLVNQQSYKVTLSSDLKTVDGVQLKKSVSGTVVVDENKYDPTTLSQVAYIGNHMIRITNKRGFALDVPNVLNTNYNLTSTLNDVTTSVQPIGITYANRNTIILRFESFDDSRNYELSANKIILSNGIAMDLSTSKIPVIIEPLK